MASRLAVFGIYQMEIKIPFHVQAGSHRFKMFVCLIVGGKEFCIQLCSRVELLTVTDGIQRLRRCSLVDWFHVKYFSSALKLVTDISRGTEIS